VTGLLQYRGVRPADPVTKDSDSRAKRFVGESVEIDAMSRDVLLEIVESCITQHLPPDALARMQATEAAQRETLAQFLGAWTGRTSRSPNADRRAPTRP
jgi:hypothetical protein